jgi:AraC-like DNA-binding protein/quercetin dioxygenase-like cupin family protein
MRRDNESRCEGVVVHAKNYPKGTQLGTHVHSRGQLLFSAQGFMLVSTPKGRWLVPPRQAVWLPPNVEHAIDALAELQMRTLYFDPTVLAEYGLTENLASELVVVVEPLLRELILAMFDPVPNAPPVDLLTPLLLWKLTHASRAQTFVPMPTDSRMRRVAELALSDPQGAMQLEALADAAGVSPRTIGRLFPMETGLTFKRWRQRARIMAAIEVIGGGASMIKKTAIQLGYHSVAAFSVSFQDVMGTTPTDFIEEHSRDWMRN